MVIHSRLGQLLLAFRRSAAINFIGQHQPWLLLIACQAGGSPDGRQRDASILEAGELAAVKRRRPSTGVDQLKGALTRRNAS